MASNTRFDQIYKRIQDVTGTRTQNDLAHLLEIQQSSISDAKRRDSIPADWFLTLFEKQGINPDWLKHGTGPRFLRTKDGYCVVDKNVNSSMEKNSYDSDLILPVYTSVYSMSIHLSNKMLSPVEVKKIVLPRFYLQDGISVFAVQSDALSPFVLKGAYVGIHRARKNITSGEILALFLPPEGIILGRLFYDDKQSHYFIKNNVTTVSLSSEELESRIMGTLEWILQKI